MTNNPTKKQIDEAIAERERAEGMVSPWRLGSAPWRIPSKNNPNATYDPETRRFIRGTGYYD